MESYLCAVKELVIEFGSETMRSVWQRLYRLFHFPLNIGNLSKLRSVLYRSHVRPANLGFQ